jgi:hypothetical protein
MDHFGYGRRFNAFAAPQDNHKTSSDGPGLGTAIMLHLGTQLRAYYDRLLSLPIQHHVTNAADVDKTGAGKPPTNNKQ